jgi:Zn-dependent protease
MSGLDWNWGAFIVYVFALVFMVLGGLYGLYESRHHPAFLAPVLMGLFFYLTWEAVVDDDDSAPLSPPRAALGPAAPGPAHAPIHGLDRGAVLWIRMRDIKLGAIFGIPILVNPSFFVLFAIITVILGTGFYPDAHENASAWTYAAMAAVSAPLFFASIVVHELAHSLVARLFKIPVKSITLFALGGVAHISRDATRPYAELLMAVAGPLMSVLVGAGFLVTWILFGANEEGAVAAVLVGLGGMNLVLAVFNMIPLFPMDGGRVFRAVVWLITGNYYRATSVAAWTGRVLAWALMGAGALGMAGVDVTWPTTR